MSDKLEIIITGKNGVKQTFEAIIHDSQAMGQSVEKAGKQGAKGMQELGKSAKDVEALQKRAKDLGTGLGTLVGGIALAGRASVSQAQQIRGLDKAYGDASRQMQQFARTLQDTTIYSDDAARQSEQLASTLTRNYGLTADQIEVLIERTADLATINVDAAGKQFGLVDAVQRTSSLLRGESESAEALGLSLSDSVVAAEAARRGITNWNSGLDEASKAQFRYKLFLESTTYSQGEAAAAAETNAGKARQFINSLQDQVQSLGDATGGLGEYLSILGEVGLALPVVTGLVGRLGAGLAAAGGLATLGPLAALAGSAYYAYDLNTNRGGWAENVTAGLLAKAAGFANVLTPGNVFSGIQEQFQGVISGGAINKLATQLFYSPPGDLTGTDKWAINKLKLSGVLPPNFTGTVADAADYINSKAGPAGMTSGQFISGQLGSADYYVFDPITQQWMAPDVLQEARRQRTMIQSTNIANNATSYVGSPGTNFGSLMNGPLPVVSPWFPTRGANPQADYVGYQAQITAIRSQIDDALIAYIESGAVDAANLLRAAYPNSPVAYTYQGSDRYATTDQAGITQTRFDVQAQRGTATRDQFATGYQVTIQQPQAWGQQSQGLADLTTDLVNQEGVLGKWDDLVKRGVIDLATQQWANFRDIQDDANGIFATNAQIQDDVTVIQLRQLGYNADLLEQYGEQIHEISLMGEAEQRRTLAMMDSTEQAKVAEAATIAYRVATGELAATIGTDLIAGMARADPMLADLLEQYGLISRTDGTITVNFPDKESLIEGVAELSGEVRNLVELLSDYIEVQISSNAPEVQSEIDNLKTSLVNLDGTGATVDVGVNYTNYFRPSPVSSDTSGSAGSYATGGGGTGGGYDGSTSGAYGFAHGGVIPAAHGFAGGGDILVGEFGPELIRRGGGEFVLPTGATRAQMASSGAGVPEVHLHFHAEGSIVGVPEITEFVVREMTPALQLALEQFYAGQGLR